MFDTDEGEWRIVHPRELIATFLLPLPDPIALRDGGVLATHRGLDNARLKLLEPWFDEFWMQRSDGSALVPLSELLAVEVDESAPANWSNKFAMHTSIQFHQTFSDAGLRLGLDPAIRLAKVISGPPLTREEKARALDQSNVDSYLDAPELREMGLGAASVAECVVGLRIVGELPELDSPLPPSGFSASLASGPTDSKSVFPDEPTLWQWHMFAPGTAPPVELVERRIRNALEVALADLRSIQRGVQLIRRAPTAISTLERLPFAVPVVLRLAGDIGDDEGPVRELLLLTRPDSALIPHIAPEPIPESEMSAFSKARQRAETGPFAAHADVFREAHAALERLGDYRLAVLLFGIAAESLLDEVILHLMWEEALTPEDAAEGWTDGLQTRIRQELPGRLGGPWDVTGRNPIGAWAQEVASPRHRVAHAAYMPTKAEAHRSFAGVNQLVTHLCDRLASPNVRKRYPRTALALAGEQGLRRRSAYTKKLRELENDQTEVLWTETFHRWHEAWRRTRQDQTTQPRVPDGHDADLLAVRHPDRSLIWIRHDRAQHLATEVDVHQDDLPPEFSDQLHSIADLHDEQVGVPTVTSIAVQHAMRTTYRPGSLWVEEYHHVPMTEVMIDRSDYHQATGLGMFGIRSSGN